MRRILSIDGGGIKGTFPAAVLANLEAGLEYPIGRYFDLIAGTSTGGIIAIGLALGIKASEILDFYESEGPKIFDQTQSGFKAWFGRKTKDFGWCFRGPKYESAPLKVALNEAFGKRRLGDAKSRLLIPSWHPRTQKVYIFKTAHHERLATDYKELAVDVAMATAAAPTFFEQYTTANDVGLIDGGIWANNPTGIAVVEATGLLEWPADQLKVLSIGCLEDISEMKTSCGTLGFSRQAVGMFMAGQSHSSLGVAHILTGDPHARKAIFRVTQPVPKGFYSLDNVRRIDGLKDRAFAEAREQKPILAHEFFSEPAEPFYPNHRCQHDD